MDWMLPAAVALAAIVMTYFMCIRPMRRGQCASVPTPTATQTEPEPVEEIALLRAEVAELRARTTTVHTNEASGHSEGAAASGQ